MRIEDSRAARSSFRTTSHLALPSASGFQETLELLNEAKAGDRGSLQELLERYRPVLLSRIRLMMGEAARRQADSGDFLQALFVQILQGLETFEPRDEVSFRRWAVQIARNGIRQEVRKKREQSIESFARSRLGDADTSTPSRNAEQQEEVQRLVEALDVLSDDQRRVIELRHFDRESFAEIGRIMNRSANAVQLLHARAAIRLGEIVRRSRD